MLGRGPMPIYEYRCENGHLFEVMQRITDDPVVACATCEAPVQRVFHPIAVHFKGSGFYNTDYGTSKRKREEAASKSADSAPSDASSSSAKDGKPAGDSGAKSGSGSGGTAD